MSQIPPVVSTSSPAPGGAKAPQPPAASPATPAAAKKKSAPRKRKEPPADGSTPPPPKKRKKEETPGTEPKPKKPSVKKSKTKEGDEPEVAPTVGDAEAAERRAQWEAEEAEAKSEGEDVDNNAWHQRSNDHFDKEYKRRFGILYSMMTPAQEERYSKFRASSFAQDEVVREVLEPIGIHASDETCVVLKAIGKVFVGDLIDLALNIMEEWGDIGPIRPVHLREAYSRMERTGILPNNPKTLKFGIRR